MTVPRSLSLLGGILLRVRGLVARAGIVVRAPTGAAAAVWMDTDRI
jgi:hypothetical protein